MSKKVSGWPLIAPTEVDTSITGDQVMEALASDVESGDNGKVLTAIYGGLEGEETGSVEWADAPSGLPEITNADEGKVLTVVEGEETIIGTVIPEQTVTVIQEGGSTNPVPLVNSKFDKISVGDVCTLTVNGNSESVTVQEEDGVIFVEGANCNIAFMNNETTFGASAGTYTVSMTGPIPELIAGWAKTSEDVKVVYIDASNQGVLPTMVSPTFEEIVAWYNNADTIIVNINTGDAPIVMTDISAGELESGVPVSFDAQKVSFVPSSTEITVIFMSVEIANDGTVTPSIDRYTVVATAQI